MLWRGHANQGRCQPGRRANLEENQMNLTQKVYREQGFISSKTSSFLWLYGLVFNNLHH
jgi:hypothetical protein